MTTIEEALRSKYEKKKRRKEGYTVIWIIAVLLAFAVLFIGILEFFLDYKIQPGIEGIPASIIDPLTNEMVDVYPVFGFVAVPTGQGGILPNQLNINLNDWIAIAICILIGIPAFVYWKEQTRLKNIENNLPYLLREISDSQRIGMHLPRAIEEAAKRNYGPLTPELKKLSAKVSWGISFRDAMLTFRDSVSTHLVRHAVILILEAERSGGDLEEIFESATNHVQEQLDIKRDREKAILPYVFIIYISYMIFCVVVLVLFSTFFVYFGSVSFGTTLGGGSDIKIPLHAFYVLFFYTILSQGFFSGLTAGKMGIGSVKSGLMHSTIMVFFGFLFFKFLIS